MNILSLFRRNPGHDLAMIRVRNDRTRILARARQLREEMGLPPVKALQG